MENKPLPDQSDLSQRLEQIPASADLRLVPIRHHSPACAYHLRTLIQRDRPESILIEGPADATPLLPYLGEQDAVPPLAFYCYYRAAKNSSEPHFRSFYPMAAFSPEWVALRGGLAIGATVKFIDLPYGERSLDSDEHTDEGSGAEVSLLGERDWLRADPMARLLDLSECRDFNEWWDRYFESGAIALAAEDYFRNVLSWCLLLRDAEKDDQGKSSKNSENDARERYMAANIQAELEQGRRCLVITGGYHSEAIAAYLHGPARKLKITESKTRGERGVYLLPYTLQRLDSANYYAAGIPDTGYYQEVWQHLSSQESQSQAYVEAGKTIALRVGHALAEAGEPVTLPDSIEANVLGQRLAALRATPFGRPELLDAMITAFGKDALVTDEAERLRFISRQMVKDRLGQLPGAYPLVPLVADFREQCGLFKLPLTVLKEQQKNLDIYRRERHRQISRLLHQLRFLDIPYAVWQAGPDFTTGTELARVREIWQLRWQPETEAALTECMMYGARLQEAALQLLLVKLERDDQQTAAPALLIEALRMGLHSVTGRILPYIERWLTDENEFPNLVKGLRQLHLAYSAQTALASLRLPGLQPLLVAAFERACLRLTWLGQMDEQTTDSCLNALADLNSLARSESDWKPDLNLFLRCVETLYQGSAPASLQGQAVAILTVRQIWNTEQSIAALHSAFSQARVEADYLGNFLIGFLPLARHFMLQTPELIRAMGEVMRDWDEETFLAALPNLRLAFTALKPRETAELGKIIGHLMNRDAIDVDTLVHWSEDDLRELRELQGDTETALQAWGFESHAK